MNYFYRQGQDIYNASNQQKIGSTDWQQNWSGKATELTAIDGAKYNTKELQQANYDNVSAFGNTLYGVKKATQTTTPTIIGNDLATNLPDNTVNTSLKILADRATEQSQANQIKYQQMKETEQKLQEAQAEQARVQAEKQGQADDFNNQIKPSVDKTIGMYNEAVDAFSQTDFQDKYDKLQKLEDDIVNYSNLLNQELDGVQTSGRLYGFATSEKNRIQQNYTSKIYTAQAATSAIQGNLTFAFDIIDRGANSVAQIANTQKVFLQTIDAMFADKEYNAKEKVTTLTADQKEQIGNLIADLEAEEELIKTNKEKLMETMRTNPELASGAGLTYTDTEEQWTQKIVDYYKAHPEANNGDVSFEVVGKDEDGNSIYGFVNKTDQTVKTLDGNSLSFSDKDGMRTDRHKNPTALMWTPGVETFFKSLGYDVSKGDAFPVYDNAGNLVGKSDTQFTLNMSNLEDPVKATIDYIDEYSFYTGGGQQRWSHTALPEEEWNALNDTQKRDVVKLMYSREGGNGSIFEEENNYTKLKKDDVAKFNKEIVTSDAYKAITDSKRVWDLLVNFKDKVDEYGINKFGQEAQELSSSYTTVLMTLKEFLNLGVLNGPDLDVMKEILPDPTEYKNIFRGGKDAILEGISAVKQMVTKQVGERYSDLENTYGGYSPEQLTNIINYRRKYNDISTLFNSEDVDAQYDEYMSYATANSSPSYIK